MITVFAKVDTLYRFHLMFQVFEESYDSSDKGGEI